MKTLKKSLACLLIITLIFNVPLQTTNAYTKKWKCGASGRHLDCGTVQGNVSGRHLVVEPNGYSSWCTVIVVSGQHTNRCNGCFESFESTYATCSEIHSHEKCYDKFGLCN